MGRRSLDRVHLNRREYPFLKVQSGEETPMLSITIRQTYHIESDNPQVGADEGTDE